MHTLDLAHVVLMTPRSGADLDRGPCLLALPRLSTLIGLSFPCCWHQPVAQHHPAAVNALTTPQYVQALPLPSSVLGVPSFGASSAGLGLVIVGRATGADQGTAYLQVRGWGGGGRAVANQETA